MTRLLFAPALAAVLSWTTASAAEFEKYVFDSADVVVVVEVKKLLAAPLVKKHLPGDGTPSSVLKGLPIPDEKAKKALEDKDVLAFLDLLGTKTDRVAVVAATTNPDKAVIVFEGKYDDEAIEKGLTAAVKAGGKAELKKHSVGDVELYEIKGNPKTMWVANVEGALVMTTSEADAKETIDIAAGKKKWTPAAGVAAALGKAAAGKTIWMAGHQAAQELGFHGGFTVTEDLEVDFTVDAKDENTAAELEKAAAGGIEQGGMFAAAIPELGEVLKTVKTTRAGKSVTVKAKATGAQLEKIGKGLPALLFGGM